MTGAPRLNQTDSARRCKMCEQWKEFGDFSFVGHYVDGTVKLHSYCRPCYRKYRVSRIDPVKEAERRAAYHKANAHIAAANSARRRAAKPEQYAASRKAWRAANPDKVSQYSRTKGAKRRLLIGSQLRAVTASDWERIKDATGGRCFYCGLAFLPLTQDHFFPLSLGGDHTPDNIVPACGPCNSKKHNKEPLLFAELSGRHLVLEKVGSKRENAILAGILVAITALPQAMFWRNNSGSLPTPSGARISFGLPGSPDIIGVLRGRAVGIEAKTKRGRLSEQQRKFRKKWEASGGLYVLAHSAADALAALGKIP